MDYDEKTMRLKMKVNWNQQSAYCQLFKNDAIEIKIILINSSQVLQTHNIDFRPGEQNFEITGFNMSLQPQVRIWFYKQGALQDSVAIYNYVVHNDNSLIQQEIQIIIIILTANLAFVLVYLLIYFVITPLIKQLRFRKRQVKQFKPQPDEDIEV
ncbi:Hypothetical_protein [Hexamita inflata]|uniref:Hypothetical_protein n=1 Tax=Hexamita inflata TaxID=28002 RepID=A0AA86VSV4_9EUKA|nr:Hypothetical protein HINF_LOCUS64158 [Hexamita inflata]